MFSKALFKQSAKANWMKWVCVTVATCVMLAIVIIVLGNLGINDIRDSLKNVFTQADQESSLKEESVDAYDSYFTIMGNYDSLYTMLNINLNGTVLEKLNDAFTEYDSELEQFVTENSRQPNEDERATIVDSVVQSFVDSFGIFAGAITDEIRASITGIITYYSQDYTPPTDTAVDDYTVIDSYFAQQVYDQAYAQEIAKEDATVEYATTRAESASVMAEDIIERYKADVASAGGTYVFNAENYITVATDYVNDTMYNSVYDMQIEEGATADDAKITAVSVKVISNTAISTYQLWLDEFAADNQASGAGEITAEQKESARSEAIKSISDQIPEKVGEALTELGNMDIYGLIIGSIFYRIAGLLLPMVFVIMTANGLLAGQVDSGSMAYVLSTPTKRRTVTVTQMTYLITSLLAMYLLLTVVSVISIWVVGGNSFAINYGEILLFNLGAFLTMFAFAGFCFMCSALFNRSKHSMSIGGGLTIFMLVCTILGLFGSNVVPSAMRIDAMNFFNYLSIISFFDTVSILDGGLSYLWKFAILLGIGIVTFIIGIFRFDKKDLPL